MITDRRTDFYNTKEVVEAGKKSARPAEGGGSLPPCTFDMSFSASFSSHCIPVPCKALSEGSRFGKGGRGGRSQRDVQDTHPVGSTS
jgi:hypothetical protein